MPKGEKKEIALATEQQIRTLCENLNRRFHKGPHPQRKEKAAGPLLKARTEVAA